MLEIMRSTQKAAEAVNMNTTQVTATLNPLIQKSITNTAEELGKLKSELLDSIEKANTTEELEQLKYELLDSIQKTNTAEELGNLKSELLGSIEASKLEPEIRASITSTAEELGKLKSELLDSIEASKLEPEIRASITNTTEELGKLKSELLDSIEASKLEPEIHASITSTTEELETLKFELLDSIKANTKSSQEVVQTMKSASERMHTMQANATQSSLVTSRSQDTEKSEPLEASHNVEVMEEKEETKKAEVMEEKEETEEADSTNDDEFQPVWRKPQFRNRMAGMTNRFIPTDKEFFEMRKAKGSMGEMLDFQKHLFNNDSMVLYTLNPPVSSICGLTLNLVHALRRKRSQMHISKTPVCQFPRKV